MGKGLGKGLGMGLGLQGVKRAAPSKGERGSTVYPSVLEAYNRDSDYRRWLAGQALHQGAGGAWADLETHLLVRPLVDDGTVPGVRPVTVTAFPSAGAPNGNWTVACRRRGALMLPQALDQGAVEIDQRQLRPELHRLRLDVSGSLSPEQLEHWRRWIGDQFEDGASAASYPAGLLDDRSAVVAMTLVEVDVAAAQLVFDLSRPYRRRWVLERSYWSPIRYEAAAPALWRLDGSRYLISSHRFHCNCPDHSGQQVADLSGEQGGQARFPRPSAGRVMANRWEQQQVGYSRRWRDLPQRADQRRECKHIHGQRWAMGIPFDEPSDYGSGRLSQAVPQAGGVMAAVVARSLRRKDLSLDQLVPALAAVNGLELDSRDRLEDGEALDRSSGELVLWTSSRAPEASWCLAGDWWLRRGTSELKVFDGALGRFTGEANQGGVLVPVVETVAAFGRLP